MHKAQETSLTLFKQTTWIRISATSSATAAVPSKMNTRFKSVGSDELAVLVVYNSLSYTKSSTSYCSYCSMGVKKVQHTAAQYRLKHTIPQTASLVSCSVSFIVHCLITRERCYNYVAGHCIKFNFKGFYSAHGQCIRYTIAHSLWYAHTRWYKHKYKCL